MSTNKTLALIIPAYNEERHLGACLDSIALQSVKPDEVIVIDNNSTDTTAAIAQQYPFVRLVREKKQGLIAARDKGFREAKSDLLGRIDADSILTPDWVEVVHEQFEKQDVDGISGPGLIYVLPIFPNYLSTYWSRWYFLHVLAIFRFPILWGPNMVIRRAVWQKIKKDFHTDDKQVHEDQDISVVMRAHGFTTKHCKELNIISDGERLIHFPKAVEYKQRQRNTVRIHRRNGNLSKARLRGISRWSASLVYIITVPFFILFYLITALVWITRSLTRSKTL